MRTQFTVLASATALMLGLIDPAIGQEQFSKEAIIGPAETYSPYVGREIPREVYWGDTHLHTSNSMDAYPWGNTIVGPDEAYRFARGETVFSPRTKEPVRLRRPLDWLVVTDHSEYLGMVKSLFEGNAELLKNPNGKRWFDMVRSGKNVDAMLEIANSVANRDERLKNPKVKQSIWTEFTTIADRHNTPGAFTAFIGYEWSSMPDGGKNLHRVVIYRDGADKANEMVPYSAFDSEDPEDLWKWLGEYEERSGGSAFAIAHNGNASNGLMFSDKDFGGTPLTRAYSEARARWEPLYEVTQIKGDGEAHPILSATDEFADFENWDKGSLVGNAVKEEWMLRHEYARSALKSGLKFESELGANPFKFGLVGSTDAHTGLATADDDNFWGKSAHAVPSPERMTEILGGGTAFDWTVRESVASGYAAIWATENTRGALFDAMRRRETYATTGPRMVVRFFGGWDFSPDHVHRPDFAALGYDLGVPMGGDLTNAPDGKSPSFMVGAAKDPDGAFLDRIQIVKGWLDADGETHEKVYDVVWSGDREPGADGKLPPVGNTVEVSTATYTNTIGAARIGTVWTDPDFDPAERAFYYARVLEIPTPRWTTYDAVRYGKPLLDDVPASTQQRAYTSPIWYTP